MKGSFRLKVLSLVLFVVLVPTDALAIKKCKDADGKWHYGDNAQQFCEDAKVTTLTQRGFVKDTMDAPKTEEELAQEAKLLEQEKQEAERERQEQAERDRILSIYEREADIDRQRDNKLASVDGNIRVHKAYLKQMDAKVIRLEEKSSSARGKRKELIDTELVASKERIEEFSTELKRLEAQKVSITEKFAREKELYKKFKIDGK